MSFQPDAFQDDSFQIWSGSIVYTIQWQVQAMPRRFEALSSNRNRVTQALPRAWQTQADKHV